MIKDEKSNFYRNMLIQAKGNTCTCKLWSCLNEVIGKPSSCINRVLNTDSGLLTDALELANFLNTYFINIASQVTAHLPPSTDYAPSTQFNDFYWQDYLASLNSLCIIFLLILFSYTLTTSM